MRIPPEKIDEVRNAIDIVDLIGRSVALKKRGKNYVGLCPFHNEKTPSFNVSADRQMYHCFGCGVGGNVFTFVMETEKISFPEAVRSLAEKAGITLPQATGEEEAIASEQEQLYEICREAGLYYHQCLAEGAEGKFALEYLRGRGMTDETIRTFGLGYAPKAWDALVKHASDKSIPEDLLVKAGLARRREDGSLFDYFRGRAMFPIFSATGRVVGFGARKLFEDDALGKYINSPETPIYSKSRILYGLSQSKDAIRENDRVILVEGYLDLLSVYQAGLRNVVASSGTALTGDQIRLVSRYTRNITMVYDADSAGAKASLRGVDLLLENDLDVRIAALPAGDDPDSFVRAHDGGAFLELVDHALSFVDFIAAEHERLGLLSTPEGQARTVRAIVQTIARMPDELKRNFTIKQVAEKYRLYESTLYRELEKTIERTRKEPEQAPGGPPTAESADADAKPPPAAEVPALERDLISAMLEGGPEVCAMVFSRIGEEEFTHPQARRLAQELATRWKKGEAIEPTTLVDALDDPDLRRLVTEALFTRYQISKSWGSSGIEVARADPRTLASDALRRVRMRSIGMLLDENQRRLKEATRKGQDITPYLERHQQLLLEMKNAEVNGGAERVEEG